MRERCLLVVLHKTDVLSFLVTFKPLLLLDNNFCFCFCLGHDAGISQKAIKLRPIAVIKG